MIVFDSVFWGWYQILDKTLYSVGDNKSGIGPREHAFFIAFLLHGINLWTVLSLLLVPYLKEMRTLYVGLFCLCVVFAVGYYVYFKRARADVIISSRPGNLRIVFSLVISLAYSIISVYVMFTTGDYFRDIVGG